MEWADVLKNDPIYLNLGGACDRHPTPHYEHYVTVDLKGGEGWAVEHDLSRPFPLPQESVDRIISEHFFEHVAEEDAVELLRECHRVLKRGGLLRIAVPDYMHPRSRKYLRRGFDPRHSDHLMLPTYESFSALVNASPFERHEFYQYWDGDTFVRKAIDYTRGHIKRTPEHDRRNCRSTLSQKLLGAIGDGLFLLSRGFVVRKSDFMARRGHPLRVTSIVVDLIKG